MQKQKEYNQCCKQIQCFDCQFYSDCTDWIKFIELHKDLKPYAHFDKRVSLAMPTIRRYVMNKHNIIYHSFYPFIHFTKRMSRYGNKKSKNRELYYCSHLDRCVFQRYAFLINQKYNQRIKSDDLDDVAIAYRSNLGKNNIDFAKDAFETIKSMDHCLVIVGDFTKFFDKLDHNYLKKMLCDLLEVQRLPDDYYSIFKNITRFSSWDWNFLVNQSGHKITERGVRKTINSQDIILSKEDFKKYKKSIQKNNSGEGIPQGSPISAVLSNVFMLQFDKDIHTHVLSYGGKYMRYSDDFLIVLPYRNEQEVKFHKEFIFSAVSDIDGLDLQPDKTAVYVFDNGSIIDYALNASAKIDYLGFVFDGINIKLRPKAITKYYYRMRRKARHIGSCDWVTSSGKHITAKNLYDIYSTGGDKQTFIDYIKCADSKLHLLDYEASALIKHHKRKIAQAIKSGERKLNNN